MDLASVTQTAPGPATPGPRPGVNQELRLALAMRGGVSLAVWIGGAVAEIERLRRSGTGEAVHPVYHALLGLGRYSTVTIDVLAGASAGGLNAAVYAAAQCHGFDVAEMRPLWMALGDIEASSRATTSAGRAAESPNASERDALRPPSLLDGDGYFFPELARRLESFIVSGRKAIAEGRRQPVGQVDLLLSATLFQPRDIELLLNRHNRVRETGAEALFRFRRAPGRDDFDVEPSIRPLAKALAMAARSTSSFPIAFEPACISVGTGRSPDFGHTFELPGGRPIGDVAVIDGGTLDNIPVGAALRAIVDSPAGGPTERWLFYLNPSPPEPEAAGAGGDAEEGLNSPGAVATVVRTLTTRFGVESLLTDVRELETVNEAARRRRLTMAAAFAGIQTDGEELVAEIAEAVDDRTAELAEIWMNLDVSAVIRALRRPAAGDAVRAHLEDAPLAHWTDEDELALAPALQAVLAPSPVEGTETTMWRSPAWTAELTRLLISWARSIEHRVDDPRHVGGVKAQAYRLRALAGALDQAQRQQWLAAAPHYDAETMTVEGWAAQTGKDMLRRVPDAFARRIPATLIWSDALEALLADVDFTLGEHGDHDLGEAIWWAACRVATRLQKIGARAPGQDPGQPGWEIFRRLETLADPARLRAGLAGLVTLSAPLALLGPAPDSEIRFAQLTGRASTPLHWRFSALKEQRLRQPGAPGRSAPLRPADKLCGDELANFSAFLSAKWRANDWMWGRLDAASTMVDNLLDPDRLARQHDGETTRLLDRLEDALAATPRTWVFDGLPKPARWRLEQGPGDDPEQWDEWVAAVTEVRDGVVERLHWEILAAEVPTVNSAGHDPREVRPPPAKPAGFEETKAALADYDVGLQGLADLGDKRRVRMFLRAALVAFGTLRPGGESVSAVAGRWAATALKPLYLIAVFVAASLRRGLFVAAIALASLQVTYWRAEDDLHRPGAFSLTAAVAGAALLLLLASVPARSERLRVAGLALAALAVLFTLWDAGGLWAATTLVALGLGAVTLVSWWGRWRRGTAGWRDHGLGLATLAAGTTGIVLGGTRAVCRAGCDEWATFTAFFATLAAVALVVAATGTFWMRRTCRVAALFIVIAAYAGTAGPFAGPAWPAWARNASTAAAVSLAAGLTFLAARDARLRNRRLGKSAGSLGLILRPALAGLLALALSRTTVPWPQGVWIILAIAAAGSSLTVLATYVDVLKERPSRRLRTSPETAPLGTEQVSPAPDLPASTPSVSGEPVATA